MAQLINYAPAVPASRSFDTAQSAACLRIKLPDSDTSEGCFLMKTSTTRVLATICTPPKDHKIA